MKKEIMTLPEFLAMTRKDELEVVATKIRKNKRIERMTVFVLGSLMYSQKVFAGGTGKIDNAGITILGVCRQIGYWACIIMCVIEIIRSLMQGDTKSISKIISKYVLGFAALYLVPWIFDLIKEVFA